MKKNKKILLTLGTLASVAAPVAAVVSCGSSLDNGDVSGKSIVTGAEKLFTGTQYEYKILPTYTGQADQLLSLGIKPDRYPFQLDKTAPFSYITNPAQYMIGQDQDFKDKFAAKLASLMPEDRGTSWWNQQALDAGDKGSDPEYWQHRAGDFTMYEHYLLDDGAKIVDTSIAPKHADGSHTFVQTNFRESRDPFTRMPKRIMIGLLDKGVAGTSDVNSKDFGYESLGNEEKALVNDMLAAARYVEGVKPTKAYTTAHKDDKALFHGKSIEWTKDLENKTANDWKSAGIFTEDGTNPALAVDGKPLPSGIPNKDANDDNSWLYNDYFFANAYHKDFLDNVEFSGSTVHKWIINEDDAKKTNVFDKDATIDKQLAKLFFTATYTDGEKELKAAAEKAYGFTTTEITPQAKLASAHHPIYEQQEDIGGAPMFEGAQRDNMLYFYNTASRITDAFTPAKTTDSQADQDSYNALKKAFHIGEANVDPRVAKLLAAQNNSVAISDNLRARMAAIKPLVDAVRAQQNGKKLTFGLVTLAPGEGQTTLQTSSKYSFLYNELGFDQATPDNLKAISDHPELNVPMKGRESTFFNMDDNGWWWNLGEGTKVLENAAHFKGALDMGLVTANDTQFKNLKGNEKNAVADMFKDKTIDKVDYNLWNEGLKTPFVMNMMLDKITDMLIKKDTNGTITDAQKTAAKAWGTYWTDTFVA